MSPYRVPWPPEAAPPVRRHRTSIALGALWVITATVAFVHQWLNARRLDELTAQLAAVQAAEDDDAHAIAALQGPCSAAAESDNAEERAALQRQIEDARRHEGELRVQGALPKCRCSGTGDPLCAEIPGQSCAP